jgi:hypothetical protein
METKQGEKKLVTIRAMKTRGATSLKTREKLIIFQGYAPTTDLTILSIKVVAMNPPPDAWLQF